MSTGFPLIDITRMIAAILVIAIHISPFGQISPDIDFFITRILGRLAVPFFFIVTGYFIFRHGYPTDEKIKSTFKNLMKWYFISVVIYIPLMVYNHYFSQENLAVNILKDIFIDGTFYHLWYFPAVMIGLVIVLFLKSQFTTRTCLIITGLLYGIGLCGDAYHGLAVQVPMLDTMLNGLFQVMDYTRNGYFFAPIFLMIGHVIANQKPKLKTSVNIVFFIISFVLMGVEAYLLHQNNICKHDSMYILLPIVSYLLLDLLTRVKGVRYRSLKDISLLMYILHPFVIVAIRLLGKLINMNSLITDNMIQFLSVTLITIIISIILERLSQYGKKLR